jgi:miniconductance mechanosensitive channel
MSKLINILTVFVIVMILNALLDVFNDIYKNYKISKEHPIKSYLQVISLVIYMFSVIITIGIIFDKSPLKLLSGIGAMTAIVMLIFKDAILGFVASIQLTANKMVAIGDWIEMPSHDADGEVVEINLTNVKVENWDKTISTIPSYTLVSNSFRNWKGMTQSGGRRIKRSIFIDSSTVRFLSEEEINRLSKINLLKNYIESKSLELAEHNRNSKIEENIVNGRKLTNIGTFRIYIENYLHNSDNIDKGKTILVRQLQQTSEGIPMEIYCFANTTVWNAYEKIQSDLFDHFMAIIPEFELQLFQNPSGRDLKSLKN